MIYDLYYYLYTVYICILYSHHLLIPVENPHLTPFDPLFTAHPKQIPCGHSCSTSAELVQPHLSRHRGRGRTPHRRTTWLSPSLICCRSRRAVEMARLNMGTEVTDAVQLEDADPVPPNKDQTTQKPPRDEGASFREITMS